MSEEIRRIMVAALIALVAIWYVRVLGGQMAERALRIHLTNDHGIEPGTAAEQARAVHWLHWGDTR